MRILYPSIDDLAIPTAIITVVVIDVVILLLAHNALFKITFSYFIFACTQ
jgi:hypothetical protein